MSDVLARSGDQGQARRTRGLRLELRKSTLLYTYSMYLY